MVVRMALRRPREGFARPRSDSIQRESTVSAQQALGSSGAGSLRSISRPFFGLEEYEGL